MLWVKRAEGRSVQPSWGPLEVQGNSLCAFNQVHCHDGRNLNLHLLQLKWVNRLLATQKFPHSCYSVSTKFFTAILLQCLRKKPQAGAGWFDPHHWIYSMDQTPDGNKWIENTRKLDCLYGNQVIRVHLFLNVGIFKTNSTKQTKQSHCMKHGIASFPKKMYKTPFLLKQAIITE